MHAAKASAKTFVRTARALVRKSSYPCLADAIDARQPAEGKAGWPALPAMSIAMAIVARLAARGNSDCAALEREYRGEWANLARCAPEFVAIDLVLAEALVTTAYEQLGDCHD